MIKGDVLKLEGVINELKSLSNPKTVEGMAHFGINPENALGVSVPSLRKLAKKYGQDHRLALGLWDTKIHEARILAGMVDNPAEVTPGQMDDWTADFTSWDVCDQCCLNLYVKTPYSFAKANEWSNAEEEFVKRAAFALMACIAFKNKTATDKQLAAFLPIIERQSKDGRNYVKKAVNWALRQIGKRNPALYTEALKYAYRIKDMDSKSARWIAADAIRELESAAVQRRLEINGLL
jgi:3-methyladenine DNA glycosylase AlkD